MTSQPTVVYRTSATAHGGREGTVRSADGVLDLALARPGAPGDPKANPETLFAAGYSACFQSALNNRARAAGIDASASVVTATVYLVKTDDGGFGLGVDLVVEIPGLDRDKTQELVELAHQYCPYSKATRGNIEVTLTVG